MRNKVIANIEEINNDDESGFYFNTQLPKKTILKLTEKDEQLNNEDESGFYIKTQK